MLSAIVGSIWFGLALLWAAVVLVALVLKACQPVDCVNCLDSGEYQTRSGGWAFCECEEGRKARQDWKQHTAKKAIS